jgi:hypothetical protein
MSDLLRLFSYQGNKFEPILHYGDKSIAVRNKDITLTVNTTQRYCIGWHDLASGVDHLCPTNATTDAKHFTCYACREKTGFNPAFYHAKSVSSQQEQRNLEPHFLYLAHFGDGYIKVGISWAKRDIRRLLDQGARSTLILNSFPSANIARQYESRVAARHDIHETTPPRIKLELLKRPFYPDKAVGELKKARQQLSQELQINFADNQVLFLDDYYFGDNKPDLTSIEQQFSTITGKCMGIIGSHLITRYKDRFLIMYLRDYIGYPVEISNSIRLVDLPLRQASLF